MRDRRPRIPHPLLVLVLTIGFISFHASPAPAGESCPGGVLQVIAVENAYGSIVQQLGGPCVQVASLMSNLNADPHEFQTDVRVAKTYQTAQLVVQNGLGYDDFSDKIMATMAKKPKIVTCGEIVGLKTGDNPHVWYSPAYVMQISQAITRALKELNPSAAAYFEAQAKTFASALGPYHDIIGQIKARFSGTPVGATESIFVYMAQAAGLQLISSPEFMDAVSEGMQPTVRDVVTFHNQIQQQQISVLIYNTQTVTNLTTQLRTMAQQVGIPIIGVSETLEPVQDTFQDWQVRQLQVLLKALESRGR